MGGLLSTPAPQHAHHTPQPASRLPPSMRTTHPSQHHACPPACAPHTPACAPHTPACVTPAPQHAHHTPQPASHLPPSMRTTHPSLHHACPPACPPHPPSLQAIEEMCASEFALVRLGWSPRITFITSQKKHNTRVFPADKVHVAADNVLPGTVVEECCSSQHNEFLLVSHAGMLVGAGVSRGDAGGCCCVMRDC